VSAANLLSRNRFFIREQVAFMKTTDVYDILDPDTEQPVGTAREAPGSMVAVLRWLISKKLMPTTVEVRDAEHEQLAFSINRPVQFFRQRVDVLDAEGQRVGYFKSKLLSIGGGFWVYDNHDQQVAEIKGSWTGWHFQFLTPDGTEMGVVTKKWAGLGKALFTSADNYIVAINEDMAEAENVKMLLLAAALAIDIVYYEENQ
jgi:uncharacterized protein YxjI